MKSSVNAHPAIAVIVNLLLLLSFIFLAIGLWAPLITVKEFYFFSDNVSLMSALKVLWAEQEWGLVILLGSFSVVFPTIKILILLVIWNFEAPESQYHKKHLRWLETYSKWSMLDVFVVALLVVSIKLSSVLDAHVEYGIYAFSISVILVMLISNWMGKYTR